MAERSGGTVPHVVSGRSDSPRMTGMTVDEKVSFLLEEHSKLSVRIFELERQVGIVPAKRD